jgi:hypothetical protein
MPQPPIRVAVHRFAHFSARESPCLDQTKRPWTTIARQGRQIFRKKQFRLYGGCRVEIERGNARDRLGMDHCIRRQ